MPQLSTAEVAFARYRPVNFVDVAARINFVTLIRLRRRKRTVRLDEHARLNHVGKSQAHVVGQIFRADVVFAVAVKQLRKCRLIEENRHVLEVFTALDAR